LARGPSEEQLMRWPAHAALRSVTRVLVWAVTLLATAPAAGQTSGADAPLCTVASGQDLAIFRLLDDTVLITEGGGPAAVCPHDKPCEALAGDPTRAARRLLPAVAGTVTAAAGRWGKHVVLTRTIPGDEGENHEVLELFRSEHISPDARQ
jgi:hypothetical protein